MGAATNGVVGANRGIAAAVSSGDLNAASSRLLGEGAQEGGHRGFKVHEFDFKIVTQLNIISPPQIEPS